MCIFNSFNFKVNFGIKVGHFFEVQKCYVGISWYFQNAVCFLGCLFHKVSYNIIFFSLKGIYLVSLLYHLFFKFLKKGKIWTKKKNDRTRTCVWGQECRGKVGGTEGGRGSRELSVAGLSISCPDPNWNTNPEVKRKVNYIELCCFIILLLPSNGKNFSPNTISF